MKPAEFVSLDGNVTAMLVNEGCLIVHVAGLGAVKLSSKQEGS